jgi:hypothetical protein
MTEDKHKEIKCLGEEGSALIQIVDPHFQEIASRPLESSTQRRMLVVDVLPPLSSEGDMRLTAYASWRIVAPWRS